MFGLGMQELVIIGIVAVLLFGKRLPEVAKSLGGSYREFRRGLTDLQSQVDLSEAIDSAAPTTNTDYSSSSSYDEYDDYDEATAPQFEPPPAEPQEGDGQSEAAASEPTEKPPEVKGEG